MSTDKKDQRVFVRDVKIRREAWHKLRSSRLWEHMGAESREDCVSKLIEAYVDKYGANVDVIFVGDPEKKFKSKKPEEEEPEIVIELPPKKIKPPKRVEEMSEEELKSSIHVTKPRKKAQKDDEYTKAPMPIPKEMDLW